MDEKISHWLSENGWTEPHKIDGFWFAYPPQAVMPCLLPSDLQLPSQAIQLYFAEMQRNLNLISQSSKKAVENIYQSVNDCNLAFKQNAASKHSSIVPTKKIGTKTGINETKLSTLSEIPGLLKAALEDEKRFQRNCARHVKQKQQMRDFLKKKFG